MRPEDWNKVRYFTEAEVRGTGANPEGVRLELLQALDRFRQRVGVPVHLVKDGFNSGVHRSPGHPDGRAVDGFVTAKVSADSLFKFALEAGFKAIGLYWNGATLSFHLELSDEYRFWTGRKEKPGVGSWKYGELVNDPSTL